MKLYHTIILYFLFISVVYSQIIPIGFVSSSVDAEAYVDTYVTIGAQKWLDHDLDITTYNDGTAILFAENEAEWAAANSSQTGVWCYNDYDSNTNIKLYNYYAIENVTNNGLIPNGWHLPSKSEYEALLSFIGGGGEGQALKLMSPNFISSSTEQPIGSSATNDYGFNALRTKYIKDDGRSWGYQANWWTDTPSSLLIYTFATKNSSELLFYTKSKGSGMAIRLLKDN